MSTVIGAEMTNNTILDSRFNFYNNKRPEHHPLHFPYLHKRSRTQDYPSTTPPINQLLISPFNINAHIPPNFQNPNLVPPPLNPPLSVPGLPPLSSQQRVLPPVVNSFLGEFISLSNKKLQAPTADDPIGLEFDSAKLKVRHDFVIRSLYGNLPRWEWHFRKMRNRMAKKRTKRALVSRKYFPRVDATGRFIKDGNKETEIEKEVLEVIADEDQRECPLCMESFEEFFCEKLNDWVYRGTVYLDTTKGSTRGQYRSLIGRIVHAKCAYTKEEIKSLSVSEG